RTFGPILHGNFSARLYLEPHPVYGRFHIPSTTGWLKTDEYFTRVDINSHGLREREIGYDKPAGFRRVVVLGDSFVEGAEVPAEATFTRRLEPLLTDGADQPVQVVNAGVLDFGTAQEYLLLKNEALRYSPDLVVLVFYTGNDVANNSSAIDVDPSKSQRPYFQLNSRGELRLMQSRGKGAGEEGLVARLRRES